MVALPRGELEHGGDVIGFEIGIVGENLGSIRPGRQEIQHIFHTNAHATDGRPPQMCGSTVMRWIWVIAGFRTSSYLNPGGSVGYAERAVGFSSPSKKPRGCQVSLSLTRAWG